MKCIMEFEVCSLKVNWNRLSCFMHYFQLQFAIAVGRRRVSIETEWKKWSKVILFCVSGYIWLA